MARKRQKKGFSGRRSKVFRVFWPPEAKNDPHSENTKKPDFEKNFLIFYAKRSYLASGGLKMAKTMIFGSCGQWPLVSYLNGLSSSRKRWTTDLKLLGTDFDTILWQKIDVATFFGI